MSLKHITCPYCDFVFTWNTKFTFQECPKCKAKLLIDFVLLLGKEAVKP